MDSENLSSLIRLSVSDGQKTRQFLSRIIYRYIIKRLRVSITSVLKQNKASKSKIHQLICFPTVSAFSSAYKLCN